MRVRSKRYKKESQELGKEPVGLAEAVEKVRSFKSVKFDQSIECVLQLGIDPKQASAVAGTGAKALSSAAPIWANEDTAAGDTLVRQTDAVTFNVAATVKKKQVIFQINPAALDNDNGFDVLGCAIDDSSQATNFVSVLYILQTKYPQSTPPSAIVD